VPRGGQNNKKEFKKMTTKTNNYDWDKEFEKICDMKRESDFFRACLDRCFFIKKEAYDAMMRVYRSTYREDYDPPIARFRNTKGREYFRFFGNKDEYLEFKSHFFQDEWPEYFYY
jgi:hypothetical protein